MQSSKYYYEASASIITGSPYDETKPFPFDLWELIFAGTNPNLIGCHDPKQHCDSPGCTPQ
jgi:hypothetical protein